MSTALDRHQVPVYVGALVAGGVVGLVAPAAGPGLAYVINPLLGALLFVTFLQVPAKELVRSLRDGRFLAAVLILDFVVVPLIVAVLYRFLPADPAVRLGVLLVLLCPCVDYVIVFAGLAGADNRRLLAATPLLLVAQLLLLPLYLLLFLGSGLSDVVTVGPFLRAFGFLIVIPLGLAWAAQAWAARVVGRVGVAMVPLMAGTLLVVVASQLPKLGGHFADIARVVPVYVAFLIVAPLAGTAVAAAFHLTKEAARAVVFTGSTRNSLVVLPLALALPDRLAVAAVVVVTQTLVEVIGMVIYVRAIPRLVR